MKSIYTDNGKEFLLDDDDYNRLHHYNWTESNGYAQAWIFGKRYSMHRLITKAHKGLVVDHINRKRNDNRKENLRIVTQSENMRNRDPEGHDRASRTKHENAIRKYMEQENSGG